MVDNKRVFYSPLNENKEWTNEIISLEKRKSVKIREAINYIY